MENWVKLHQQSLQTIETMRSAEIAEEIFKVWDRKLRRYLLFEEFADHLIVLGVVPDQHTVRKIMLALKGEDANFPNQLALKEFQRLFELNRFGNAACEKIDTEFKAANHNFVHQQYVRIICATLNENESLFGNSSLKPKTKKERTLITSSPMEISTPIATNEKAS